MSTSILARFFGLCLLAMGAAVIVRGGELWTVARGLVTNPQLFLLLGVLSLAAGLAVVFAHNTWRGATAMAISLIGWVMALRGAAMLIAPDLVSKLALAAFDAPAVAPAFTAFALGLGAWLTFSGFMGKTPP
ncbi:MAG TPA: hypothetical protein VG983_05735 [Caulobacterales bacterium]|nr:hypothetical protein [Caulobacterales bacterium]